MHQDKEIWVKDIGVTALLNEVLSLNTEMKRFYSKLGTIPLVKKAIALFPRPMQFCSIQWK